MSCCRLPAAVKRLHPNLNHGRTTDAVFIWLVIVAGSHWEQRILQTELMAPIVTGSTVHISPMTLAAFEDSGWYTADYSQAASYVRGKVCA